MDNPRIAIGTDEEERLSKNTFGHCQYFQVYEQNSAELTLLETRENVLYKQACDTRGRAEHLHGLLGDVSILIGSKFEGPTRKALEEDGHHCVVVKPDSLDKVLENLRNHIR